MGFSMSSRLIMNSPTTNVWGTKGTKVKPWKKILTWSILGLLAVTLLLLGLIYLLPGYDLYVVNSNSMNPTFSAGDIVATVPPGSLLVGDIQTGDIAIFQIGSEKVTHRIVSIEGEIITTKGDANEDPDVRPIAASQVNGIYLFKIPAVGYVINLLKSRNGWFLGIIVPAILLISWICVDIIKEALRREDTGSTSRISNAKQKVNQHSLKSFHTNNSQSNDNYKACDDPLKKLLQEVVKDYKAD